MQRILKHLKLWDLAIIVLLMSASFIPLLIFTKQEKTYANQTEQDLMAIISVDGQVVEEIILKDDQRSETFVFKDNQGHENIIFRDGENVSMLDANCTDRLCVRQSTIHQEGQTIVCLPHKLLIEIKSDKLIDNEIDIISQ